ncbi:MAG: hypothetical protein A2408_03135 [Candidatus Yonathbacteria bacterium RIFOXYC1_FULL_52_10]|uniref:Uncharacterized protein n=1 Tax=Candidatus Yonathbacteria bacterium RIFOXYD1_FULL_52_36 TaxID=1802730 RepID=A0A1G2SJK9_9BACT|nr:MAG: hypothetical protein A2408_03135 [Candidatus Yonathbacteria bacterium RIFOXYC1_FULL_52_10]OHA84922.1 MAG: hypothetical protein A2591_01180 [Candidatus Yonathbacteria bacterium RIFOXYD1_FULL_52_36]
MDEQNATQTPVQQPQNQGVQQDVAANVFDEKSGGIGPIVGVIIVVVLLIIGGVYYYMNMQGVAGPAMEVPTGADPTAEVLRQQSDSTNVADIEADLNSTNLDVLVEDIQAMELQLAQ